MRRLYIALCCTLAFTVLFLALWQIPQWQVRAYKARISPSDLGAADVASRLQLEKDLINAEINARSTMVQIVGGVALLIGFYFTWRNLQMTQKSLSITDEGKITDRFSKAIELLGSDKVDVRLGGIYALERIARDSTKDYSVVFEVLTTFVREHSALEVTSLVPEAPTGAGDKMKVAADVQAILNVIGRRGPSPQGMWVSPINLAYTNMHQVILDGDFAGALFNRALLTNAILGAGNFNRAWFRNANLTGAYLGNVQLAEADLLGAVLDRAILGRANLSSAILAEASLKWASLDGAVLKRAGLVSANLENAILRGANLVSANMAYATMTSAKLSGADLTGADLTDADLTGADLSDANLTEVNFSNAIVTAVNFNRARLRRTNLKTAKGLLWEQLSTANIDEFTELPPDVAKARSEGGTSDSKR